MAGERLVDQDVTLGNFGDWSKAYILDVKNQLQGKYDQQVFAEKSEVVNLANKKVIEANRDAQDAFNTAKSLEGKMKILILVVIFMLTAFFVFKE